MWRGGAEFLSACRLTSGWEWQGAQPRRCSLCCLWPERGRARPALHRRRFPAPKSEQKIDRKRSRQKLDAPPFAKVNWGGAAEGIDSPIGGRTMNKRSRKAWLENVAWGLVVSMSVLLTTIPTPARALEIPPESCGADKPPPLSDVKVLKRWCEVYEKEAVLLSAGTLKEVSGAKLAVENCTPNCGKQEIQPRGYTSAVTLEVGYQNSEHLDVTGSISGDSDWIAAIKASLEVVSGYTKTIEETIKSKTSVAVGSCEWEEVQAFLRVNVDRKARLTIESCPCWLLAGNIPSNPFEYIGDPIVGTATLTCNMALAGNVTIRKVANGGCPRP